MISLTDLERARAALPPELAEAVDLELKGWTCAEISAMLGLTLAAAKDRRHRAHEEIRRYGETQDPRP